MAITTQLSTELTQAAGKLSENRQYWPAEGGKLRTAHFTFTQSGNGDDGSSVNLVKLPPGKVRVLPTLSRIVVSALGSSRVMDLGNRAYIASDGKTTVAESLEEYVADRDVSAATDSHFGTDPKKDFFSATGIVVCARIAGGQLDTGETMEGYVMYEIYS